MISYAQNFEDVILWRALKNIERGTYVDIGANDPTIDSVSLAFYERGWRGVHVEPMPSFAAALRAARPDETVIEAAISLQKGPVVLSEFEGTGLTTGIESYARRHEGDGRNARPLSVPTITLQEVLEHFRDRDLHWLKIDVEGMEAEVLESWGGSVVRPWIVVIESTLPSTTKENYHSWERIVLGRGYKFVYFDGLNRFYLHEDQSGLAPAFGPGPNVFDGFALSGTSTATFNQHLKNLAVSARADADTAIRLLAETNVALDRQIAGIGAAVSAAVDAVRAEAADNRMRLDALLAAAQAEARAASAAAVDAVLAEAADNRMRLDALLAAAQAEARAASAAAAGLQQANAALEARGEALFADLQEATARAQSLEAANAAMAAERQASDARAGRLAREATQWRETAHAHRAEAEALRASLSWRVSAPVRWAGMGARKGAAGAKGLLRPVAEGVLGFARANPWMKGPILSAASLVPPVRRRIDRFWSVRRSVPAFIPVRDIAPSPDDQPAPAVVNGSADIDANPGHAIFINAATRWRLGERLNA